MRNRQGCLAGLLELFLIEKLLVWLEKRFGFGRGCSCSGLGCGCLTLIIFAVIAFSILTHTNWLRMF